MNASEIKVGMPIKKLASGPTGEYVLKPIYTVTGIDENGIVSFKAKGRVERFCHPRFLVSFDTPSGPVGISARSMGDAKQKPLAVVAEIDPAELAVRLMEIGIGLIRPKDERRSPSEILADGIRAWPPEAGQFPFLKMATRAIEYVAECVGNGSAPQ